MTQPHKAAQQTPVRILYCYGGPRDGSSVVSSKVPPGYKDFGGSLIVWTRLDIERLFNK